ncbi:hypothetical protein [Kaistella jeonii]|uniref:Uncharacterized protein n=1 Tax=Kaistella jeonii TaxID=266749 RepID=A0A0C1FEA6_9FLAO|nr:hypothetical protein [Kaistella jeonii]KIA90123.1 hypothetical protein OA86_05915 [Kaistella jeonii]SFB77410.1 hypothetical protein SAMN05421876_102103 [Kaistella jeonii]VEI96404.1 Uncharacterised protein [Kaistella jeonii]
MKNLLLFIFLSNFIAAQNSKVIELTSNIKDRKNQVKSLTLIDIRTDRNIGTVIYHSKPVEMIFESDNAKSAFENWFSSHNKKTTGKKDINIILENLKIQNSDKGIPIFTMKISSFMKANGKFYFIDRYQNSQSFIQSSTPKTISDQISRTLADFIKETYGKLPISIGIPETELSNYDLYLSKTLPILNTNPLREGVYDDYESFRSQKPVVNYHVVKNKKQEIVRIKNNENLQVLNNDLYAFVDNGIPYKVTPVGYLEIFKDEKGLYLITNKEELIPKNNGTMIIGAGLVGGLAGVAISLMIDSQSRKNRSDSGFYNVYVDALTGDYVFEK